MVSTNYVVFRGSTVPRRTAFPVGTTQLFLSIESCIVCLRMERGWFPFPVSRLALSSESPEVHGRVECCDFRVKMEVSAALTTVGKWCVQKVLLRRVVSLYFAGDGPSIFRVMECPGSRPFPAVTYPVTMSASRPRLCHNFPCPDPLRPPGPVPCHVGPCPCSRHAGSVLMSWALLTLRSSCLLPRIQS